VVDASRQIPLRRLWAGDIGCVFERDPAARSRWEVLSTYPGVHAVLCHRLAHRLWRRGWRYTARLLAYLARVWTAVDIHPGATIGQRLFIDHGTGVVIGETAEIGDDVTLYHGVTLGGTTWSQGKRHPTIGGGSVIGAGAKVLGPVTLGERVKVGANSVVIDDVPQGRTAVGIPAKVVQAAPLSGLNPHGIDLNHHLIPDPVASAIGCLLDRIRVLENRLATESAGSGELDETCVACDASGLYGPHAPRLREAVRRT
jgi:serine O-acetyltransferase